MNVEIIMIETSKLNKIYNIGTYYMYYILKLYVSTIKMKLHWKSYAI